MFSIKTKNLIFAAFSFAIFFIAEVSAQSNYTEYPAFGLYNGFYEQTNILECENFNAATAEGTLETYSKSGEIIKTEALSVPSNGSAHIILNDSFEIKDTYGAFKVWLNTASQSSAFSCRTVLYKNAEGSTSKKYDFAYSIPLKNQPAGAKSGIFNSINPSGKASQTFNWLSITNTSGEAFNADIEIYGEDGELKSLVPVSNLAPNSREDIQINKDQSQQQNTGIYKIIPKDNTQNYHSVLMRYGSKETDAFSFAFPLEQTQAGCKDSRLQASTMGGDFTQNWLVLGNSADQTLEVELDFKDRFGKSLNKESRSILAFQQQHILLNPVIDSASTGNVGYVDISCKGSDGLIAQSLFYGSKNEGTIDWAYAEEASSNLEIAEGEELTFGISSFFGMSNWAKLAQNEEENIPLEYITYNSIGQPRNFKDKEIVASESFDFDVLTNFQKDSVGSAGFKFKSSASLSAYLLRVISGSEGEIQNIIKIQPSVIPGREKPKDIAVVIEETINKEKEEEEKAAVDEKKNDDINKKVDLSQSFIGNSQSLAPYRNSLNNKEVHHFFTRTTFGASAKEKNLALQKGLDETVNSILSKPLNSELNNFIKNPSDTKYQDPKIAWLRHMAESDNPLQEKVALVWHDLFATSCNASGKPFRCVWHVEVLRKNALGNFRTLAQEISVDRTMLVWLNGSKNTAKAPDENFSREFWELFTLGEKSLHQGPVRLYNDKDIVEASRAFTGWVVWGGENDDAVEFRENRFDSGEKVLWQGTPYESRGNFNNIDIINLTLDKRPESAEWIAKRLFSAFVHDSPSPEVVNQIANLLIAAKWDVKPALKTILQSEAMFSAEAQHRRVKDSATFFIGFLKNTGIPYNPERFGGYLSNKFTGYEPTRPLSVQGWPLNKYKEAKKSVYFLSWLTGYANVTSIFLDDVNKDFPEFDMLSLIPKSRQNPTPLAIVEEVSELLSVELTAKEKQIIINYLQTDLKRDGEVKSLNVAENKEILETKLRGALWLISQHKNYITF